MKATISFFLRESKKPSSSGKIPFYGSIMLHRQKVDFKLSAEISPAEKLKWEPMTRRFIDNSFYVNKMMTSLEQKFNDFLATQAARFQKLTATEIPDYVTGIKPMERKTAVSYLEEYYISTILPKNSIAMGTKKITKKALNHFKAFIKFKYGADLPISEING